MNVLARVSALLLLQRHSNLTKRHVTKVDSIERRVPTIRKICKSNLIVRFNYHIRLRFCDDCRWRISRPICKSFKMKYTWKFLFIIFVNLFTYLMPLLTLARHFRVCCHPFTALRCESDFWRGGAAYAVHPTEAPKLSRTTSDMLRSSNELTKIGRARKPW